MSPKTSLPPTSSLLVPLVLGGIAVALRSSAASTRRRRGAVDSLPARPIRPMP